MIRNSKTFHVVQRLIRVSSPVAFMLLCSLGADSVAHAQQAQLITFEAPGADTKPGDYNGTYPSGINAVGAIVGSYQDSKSVFYGFVRNPDGKFITFQAPGASTTAYNGTSVTAINDAGAIIGDYSNANGFSRGFIRSPEGKFTTFDVPGSGGYGSFPVNLNQEGEIVGFYTDANLLFHSFLRQPDAKFITYLAPGQCMGGTGCYGSELANINYAGKSVGNFMDATLVHHGLLRYADGSFTTFDVPGSGTSPTQGTGCPGCFTGLSNYGEVAGIYTDSKNVFHTFIRYSDGNFKTINAPGAGSGKSQGTGCSSDCPVLLNNRGTIAGAYIDAKSVFHVFLRSPEGAFVTVQPAGSIFTFPAGLNYAGAVAGYYISATGVYHGFVRMPE